MNPTLISLDLAQRASLLADPLQLDGMPVLAGAAPPEFLLRAAPADFALFVFISAAPAQVVGSAMLKRRAEPGRIELGYGVADAARGKGVATAAVRQMLVRAFADRGVREVYAETAVDNPASRRVVEKAGFNHIGQRDSEEDGRVDQWVIARQEWHIRLAMPADLSALQAALAWAIDWRAPVTAAAPEQRIAETGHAYLLADWGRAGDLAVVAEFAAGAAGAAWIRQWTDAEHSYGYIDAATPELGIGVDPRFRGQGIGAALLAALFEQVERGGIRAISLSVEADNPALRLYERVGFRRYAQAGNAWTMIRYGGKSDLPPGSDIPARASAVGPTSPMARG